MRRSLFIVMAFSACLAAGASSAFAAAPVRDVAKSISGVPPPELPAKAAELVRKATPADRNAVAAAVLQAVSQRSPSAASAVLSALAQTSPSLPAVAAATSAQSQNSRFDQAPPHGGNPPGLNGQPGRGGPPPFVVDYTKPRPF